MTFRLLDSSTRSAGLTVTSIFYFYNYFLFLLEITALLPSNKKYWIKTSRKKITFYF